MNASDAHVYTDLNLNRHMDPYHPFVYGQEIKNAYLITASSKRTKIQNAPGDHLRYKSDINEW